MEKLKYLFWFSLGSFIALLICVNEVYASTLNVAHNIAIKNNLDQNLASCNNTTSCQVFNANSGLMYGQMTINYQFNKGYVYIIEFDVDMEYYSAPNKIPSTTLRQNGLILYSSDYSYFYYPTCTPQLTTKVVNAGSDGFGEFVTNTKLTCTIEMPNDYGVLVYINQSNSTGWIGAQFKLNGNISINTVSMGNASIIENQNQNQQQTNERLDNIENTLTDSTVDNDNVIDTFDTLNGLIDDSGVITSLMILPVNLFSQINTSVQSECTTFNLGNLFGHNLSLPCINLENILGNELWIMIDILFSGLFVYHIAKVFIRMFDNMTSLSEGDVIDD